MSSRQLEERQEREMLDWVASELGLSLDELTQQSFDVDENGGNDGAVYGYQVTFADDSNPEVLAKISGLQDGRWVNIGFPPDEPEPEEY